jgi:hypothetical protein
MYSRKEIGIDIVAGNFAQIVDALRFLKLVLAETSRASSDSVWR